MVTLFLWRAPQLCARACAAQEGSLFVIVRAMRARSARGSGRRLYSWGWVWPAMALVRILSLCSVLLVARQVLAQSGEPAEQPLVEQPLELERGELRGIQVQAEIM